MTIATLCPTSRVHVLTAGHARSRHVVARALETLAVWHQRHVQRRDLARLAPEQLIDIGVSAGDAAAEVRKPFWRA